MTASLARPTQSTVAGSKASATKPTCQPADQVTSRESFNNRGEWITLAHCRNVDPDELFVKGQSSARLWLFAAIARLFCNVAQMR